MNKPFRQTLLAVTIALSFGNSYAVQLEEAVSKAVQQHPDVLAKWHQFRASGHERDVTWGRNLPSLDVVFGTGHERKSSPTLAGGTNGYGIENSKLTLTQNVFEGFATINDTVRLEHASLVRFYEFMDVSETAALEATRAYIDLYRFRKLLEMAEENYAVHRLVFDKINQRAKSGIGRGVDLEMAGARLALAESNLLTEASNLHDVAARYQRIVGESPKGEVSAPSSQLGKGLPKSRAEAVEAGFQGSPQLKAAVQNILSAQRNIAVQRAGYYPRVDLYAQSSREKNASGVSGHTVTDTVGLTVSMNLFRGGQDSSREKKAVEETSAAKDVRERVCRDLRQNLSLSFNDYLRLTEQLVYLDQHQLSTDKAREALRKQFDIGQRTLLDVLDTENEYYTARRNYLNGEMDLSIAQARYQAASGSLLKTLNLKRLDAEPPKPETELDADAVTQCPPEPALYPEFDKNAVYTRAKAKEDLLRSQTAAQNEEASKIELPSSPQQGIPQPKPKAAGKPKP